MIVVVVVSLFEDVLDFSRKILFAGRVPGGFLRFDGPLLSFGKRSSFPTDSADLLFPFMDAPDAGSDGIDRFEVAAGSSDECPDHGFLRISTCFAAIAANSASILWSERRLCHSISISRLPSSAVSRRTPVEERV